MHYSVLIIDDEKELSEYTARYFNMSGVTAAYVLTKEDALRFLSENTCSLILLDINLGEDSGFELCQMVRSTMNIPIFFISARSSEDDMLLALTIGGDDYITKPYSLSVLLAKVKAVLKRYESSPAGAAAGASGNVHAGTIEGASVSAPAQAAVGASGDSPAGAAVGMAGNTAAAGASHLVPLGHATIDLARAVVIRDGKETGLKAMEFRLLVYMLKNKNRIIKKDEFFEKIWETAYVGDVTLNVHIRHLREKIEDDPGNPVYIKTVWGTGFILEDKA